VSFVESTDLVTPPDLLPEERAALGAVADQRRRAFTAGRACARHALAALGVPLAPVLRGLDGEPVWPAGTVGSITHCEGYEAAAVARSTAFAALGLDAEPNAPLPSEVHTLVILPEERTHLTALPARDIAWNKLLFCAKESVYKAWFPLTREWLDFHDISITFAPDRARFQARIRSAASAGEALRIAGSEGRFRSDGGHLVTLFGVQP
jgi:4'-phosphopantetheinyl transferase EntD